jgi:hypothetical protein
MGSPKGGAFGDKVTEFKFFFDPGTQSGSVFSNATQEQIGESIDRVTGIPKDKIEALVEEWGPEDEDERDKLLKTLLARQKWLEDNKDDIVKRGKTASTGSRRAMSEDKDKKKPRIVSEMYTPPPWERGGNKKRKPGESKPERDERS